MRRRLIYLYKATLKPAKLQLNVSNYNTSL